MSKPVVDNYGDKRWYNKYDRLHRLDGPAVEYASGDKAWYISDKLHRLDGPAVERITGTRFWLVDGKRHRLDGPAIEWHDGIKKWYINGEILHGPLDLLEHGANWKDLVEWMTPREIAKCRTQ